MLPAAGWRSTEEEEQTGPAGRLRSRSDKEEDECKYPFSRSLPPSIPPRSTAPSLGQVQTAINSNGSESL